MQTVTGTLHIAPSKLIATLSLGTGFVIYSEDRNDLVFDSRFVPPTKGKGTEGARCLYIVLAGMLQWIDGETFEGPSAFVVPAAYFDGEAGVRKASHRTSGASYRAIEIRLSGQAVKERGLTGPERVHISQDAIECATSYVDAIDDDDRKAQALQLLLRLKLDGLIEGDYGLPSDPIDSLYAGLWQVLLPTLRQLAFGRTVAEIADDGKVTPRTMRDEFQRFATSFRLGFGGWREFARRHRLKLALLFLSNPQIPVRDIAKAIGYSNTEAFTHALYAEGLPAAGVLREQILSYAPHTVDRLTMPVTDPSRM